MFIFAEKIEGNIVDVRKDTVRNNRDSSGGKGCFLFKRFGVNHWRSSMKVGVDGVLVGLWATVVSGKTLDCGTGCGVISLIIAQRLADKGESAGNDTHGFSILGIDIDSQSVEEARENFHNSTWRTHLDASEMCFEECLNKGICYDHIISNPPFFDSGVREPATRRMMARHGAALSPNVLAMKSFRILNPGGRLTMILPADQFDGVRKVGEENGLRLERAAYVRNHPSAPVKRVLVEFVKEDAKTCNRAVNTPEPGLLVLFQKNGDPTPEYRDMGREFYLKF